MTGSIGTELRQARERAHLSIQDLSARTKIRASLLDAMEREAFDQLPAGLLTRGFLRAYAREVGLEPESIVRQYISEFDPDRSARRTRLGPETEPEPEQWDPPPSNHAKWAFVIPAIPLALAAVFFIRVQGPTTVAPPDTPAPVATTGQQINLDLVNVAQDITPPPTVAAVEVAPRHQTGGRFTIEIHPAADVWVEAVADGNRVMYELLRAGERRALDVATELTMRIGDAAAFSYSINGLPGRALGAPAQVRDVHITAGNYTTFQAQ